MAARAAVVGRWIFTIVGALALCSCGVRNQVLEGKAVWPYKETTIEQALKVKPSKRLPVTVGVAFIDTDFWSRILERDEAEFDAFVSQMRQRGLIGRVTLMQGIQSTTIADIRAAGAVNGVDTVLVIEHKVTLKMFPNYLSILYLTIIGLWIVPGHVVEASATVKASLWDVRTGYLYLSADGTGEGSTFSRFMHLEHSGGPRAAGIALRKALTNLFADIQEETPFAIERVQKHFGQ